jgi:hypothetical protein
MSRKTLRSKIDEVTAGSSFVRCEILFTKYDDDRFNENEIGQYCSTRGEVRYVYNTQ